MAHPMKGAAEASRSAKMAALDASGETISPGAQSVKMPSISQTGQTKDTQRVPTRKEGGRVCMDDDAPSKKRGDRPAFATGGAVKARKGATTVNVIVAPSGAGAPPPMPMGPPPMDMGPPPGPMGPPPGMAPPGPMGPPPGMPMRAAGGRVAKKAFGGAQIGTGMGPGRPPAAAMGVRPRPGVMGGAVPGQGAPSASLGAPRPGPAIMGGTPVVPAGRAFKKGGKVDCKPDKDQDDGGAGSGVGRLKKAKDAKKHD